MNKNLTIHDDGEELLTEKGKKYVDGQVYK